MKNLPVRERIGLIAEKWFILEPLYFMVWTTHEAVPVATIRTLRTTGGRIEYNPAFVENLQDRELEEVLKVELLRILLKHPYTRRKENAAAAYLASNITIKEHSDTPLSLPTAKDVFGDDQWARKHFEWYYDKILENAESKSGNEESKMKNEEGKMKNVERGEESQPPESEEGKMGNAEGNMKDEERDKQGLPPDTGPISPQPHAAHDYTDENLVGAENASSWDKDDWMGSLIDEKIEAAIQSQKWGTVAGRLQEMIVATLRPKLDYRRVLSAFRQRVLSSKKNLTRMKPSRRYDFQYMGSRHDFCTKLLFAIDVSGSVSSEDLGKALSTLNRFFRYGIESIDVVQFDTELKGPPETLKKTRRTLPIIGRGGTDFGPIMAYLDSHPGYDGLIIFTDGFAPRPSPPQRNRMTKILWLFNTEGNYTRMTSGLKGLGKAAFIKTAP